MLPPRIVETSRRVAQTSGRLAKIASLDDLLRDTESAEIETVVAFLSGTL